MKTDPPNEAVGVDLGRELSMRIVMWHQTVAERIGLNLTEHKCLDLLYRQGGMTAGQLAELSGLSTGAVTKVVDRLIAVNLVRRERSESDRRQVLIYPILEQQSEMGQIFASLSAAMRKVMMRYTPEQLATIQDYITETIHVLKEETSKLMTGE